MDIDDVLKKIGELGEDVADVRLYVTLALLWPVLGRVPDDRKALAAALFALHMRATRNQQGQILSEREGDLSRTYAVTRSSGPLGLSFWGRMLQDLIPDVLAATELHNPAIVVSPFGRVRDCNACN